MLGKHFNLTMHSGPKRKPNTRKQKSYIIYICTSQTRTRATRDAVSSGSVAGIGAASHRSSAFVAIVANNRRGERDGSEVTGYHIASRVGCSALES